MNCPGCGSEEPVEPSDTLLWCGECGGTYTLYERLVTADTIEAWNARDDERALLPLSRSICVCGGPIVQTPSITPMGLWLHEVAPVDAHDAEPVHA